MSAPLPLIRQGMRLINESNRGQLKYGKIMARPTGSNTIFFTFVKKYRTFCPEVSTS